MKRIVLGAAVIIVSELGMLLEVEPFWSWHTPIAWTGYIVLVDGLVYRIRGSSWLSDAPAEFMFLALVSVPLWLVFEFYNLFIRNWHYINLPDNVVVRTIGYAWAFATIWPAIFETSELVGALRSSHARRGGFQVEWHGRQQSLNRAGTEPGGPSSDDERIARDLWDRSSAVLPFDKPGVAVVVTILAGAAMLAWPLAWPSRYLAAPVWLGFIFLLDPLNNLAGGESLLADFRRGPCDFHVAGNERGFLILPFDRAINLALGGVVCGFVWEFWNYWARTKWIYTVPILEHVKLFEMPLPGYLGFPAFALECFTMYVSVRLLLWRGARRAVGL